MIKMKRYFPAAAVLLSLMLTGCKAKKESITVFAAKSLDSVMEEVIDLYEEAHPDLEILTNYDGSGALMTQISEGGAPCDLFFSAAEKQMDELEELGLVMEGSRVDLVENQLCLVTYVGSETKVTGLADLENASSLALPGGSVPAGEYARRAMTAVGRLPSKEDVSDITSKEVSEAYGGLEINECSSVGAAATAVAEHSNELGMVYYSDTFGYEGNLQIIEVIPEELTGKVTYPAALILNKEASSGEKKAAAEFLTFLQSEEAKPVFEKYHFN